jgi:hypothetical protein
MYATLETSFTALVLSAAQEYPARPLVAFPASLSPQHLSVGSNCRPAIPQDLRAAQVLVGMQGTLGVEDGKLSHSQF